MVEYTRTLDFKIAFAIGLGTMIAAGIFSLSGTAVAEIGSSAVIAFYLATMDEWIVRFILPESLHVLPPGTSGVLAALLLGVLNARGTEESGTFQLFVTGAKVAVLLAFVGGAVAFRGPAVPAGNSAAGFTGGPVGIVSIAALAFITFFGLLSDRREHPRGQRDRVADGSAGAGLASVLADPPAVRHPVLERGLRDGGDRRPHRRVHRALPGGGGFGAARPKPESRRPKSSLPIAPETRASRI